MKSLQEVLDYTQHSAHVDPAWKASGFGPTNWTTVKALVGSKPVTTDAVDAPANIDQDFKNKMMQFFDTLGEIILQDYPHDTSVFDLAQTHTADGHDKRPADRVVGEAQNPDEWLDALRGVAASAPEQFDLGANEADEAYRARPANYDMQAQMDVMNDPRVQEILRRQMQAGHYGLPADDDQQNEATVFDAAFALVNEAVIQEVGRLYEAVVAIRGMQRSMKIFYPSMGVASRRDLQESLNKVFNGAVLIKMTPLSDGSRITRAPLVILEDERYHVAENVVFDAATNTFIILEKFFKKKKKNPKDIKKKARGDLVKEAFDRYRTRLEEELVSE